MVSRYRTGFRSEFQSFLTGHVALPIRLRTFKAVITQPQAGWPAPCAPDLADPIWTSAHIGIFIRLGETQTRRIINSPDFPAPKQLPVELKGKRWDRQDVVDWFTQLPCVSEHTARELPSISRVEDLPTTRKLGAA